jgi:hypothetical protein
MSPEPGALSSPLRVPAPSLRPASTRWRCRSLQSKLSP